MWLWLQTVDWKALLDFSGVLPPSIVHNEELHLKKKEKEKDLL